MIIGASSVDGTGRPVPRSTEVPGARLPPFWAGIGLLLRGAWAVLTSYDAFAARFLRDADPGEPTESPAPEPTVCGADLPHRPVMPPLPGRIVASPPPDDDA